jgi:hypothetical protein
MAKGKFRSISVTIEVYEKLKRIAEKRGFSTLADTVAYLVAIEEEVLSRFEKVLDIATGKQSQVSSADPNQGVYERVGDILKRLVDAVKKHDEVVNRLNERVTLMELTFFGIRDIDKAIQVTVGDEVPEELRGKKPIEYSKGDGIEVEVYEY